jgi:hypothetical protein
MISDLVMAENGALSVRTTVPRDERRVLAWGFSLAIYAVLSSIVYWPISLFGSSRLTYNGDDVAEMIWFLAFPAHALKHLSNPFFTPDANYPFGANVAANGALSLLGLICAPITYLFGPIATYNFVARAAFVCSAAAMFYVLRRFVSRWPIAFAGGLLYGFSPYMIGQGLDHPFLTFVPLPPIMFVCLYELVTKANWSTRRAGITLGLCSVAQFLISAEVFVGTVIVALFGLVVVAIARRHRLRELLERLVRGGASALSVFIVLAGYPAWYTIFGPQHLTGSPQSAELGLFRTDLVATVVPTVMQRFGPPSLIHLGTSFAGGDYVENGAYIGVGLLAFVLLALWVFRRDRLVNLLGILAAFVVILSLGTRLNVDGHVTSIPLPFAVFVHLPLLQDMSAARYTLFEVLFVALLGAIALDRWCDRRAERGLWPSGSPARALFSWQGGLAVLAGAVIVVPLVPRIPYQTYSSLNPTYFVDGSARAIPSGSVVLSYPLPIWPYTHAAVWQAETDMRFKLFGGYVAAPQNLTDVGEGTPALLKPATMQSLLVWAAYGEPAQNVFGAIAPPGSAPPDDASTQSSLREFCRTYHVDDLVVDTNLGVYPSVVVDDFTSAFGPPSYSRDGIVIWYDVSRILARYPS